MGEFLYTGTKARKLNIEIFFVTFFPGNVALKNTQLVMYQKVRPKITAICSL